MLRPLNYTTGGTNKKATIYKIGLRLSIFLIITANDGTYINRWMGLLV